MNIYFNIGGLKQAKSRIVFLYIFNDADEFLDTALYKNVLRWAETIAAREAVVKGVAA